MALVLPHSIFFHIPKTGGMWVRAAIAAAGIESFEIGHAEVSRARSIRNIFEYRSKKLFHRLGVSNFVLSDPSRASAYHCIPKKVDTSSKLAFAFVRHPVSYYQSYWSYKNSNGWDAHNGFDMQCRSDSFEGFVLNTIANKSGWLTKMYARYVGPEHEPLLDFVGRQESLVDDLVYILQKAGETFDESTLRSVAPVNTSMHIYTECPEHLCTMILESEIDTVERYGYSNYRLETLN